MRRTTLTLTLIATVLLAHTFLGAAELEEILSKNYESRGGLDKLKSMQSMRMHGKTLAMGQIEAPMTVEMKRPNRLRMEFTFNGMTGIQAFDGTTAWMVMPFLGKTEAEEIPAAEAESFRQDADFDGLLVDWKDKGHTLELLGTKDVEGTEAYELKATLANGNKTLIYLDTEHCIEMMVVSTQVIPGQGIEVEITTFLSDYKEVEGVLMAHSVESRTGEQVMALITIDSVEINPDIADDRFTIPATTTAEKTASINPTKNDSSF